MSNFICIITLILLTVFSSQAMVPSEPEVRLGGLQLEIDETQIPLISVTFEGLITPDNSEGRPRDAIVSTEWGAANLTLHDPANDFFFVNWLNALIAGDSTPKNCSIVALDRRGAELMRWNLSNSWVTESKTTLINDDFFKVTEQIALIFNAIDWDGSPSPPTNTAPSLILPASFSAPVGSRVSFTVKVADADGDTVQTSLATGPNGSAINHHEFQWNVPLESIGTSNTIQIRASDGQTSVTQSTTLTIPRDFDQDAMDDDWEIIWLGSIEAEASGDFDKDGLINRDEFSIKTIPTNSASGLKLRQQVTSNGLQSLTYEAQPGIEYHLEYLTDLSSTNWTQTGATWQETNATPILREMTSTSVESNVFYRLKARRIK